MAIKIDPEKVFQSWIALLPGGSDKEERFYDLVQDEFIKRNAGLSWDFETVGSLFGKKQEYLRVSGSESGFFCLVGTQKMGKDLFVSWHCYTTKNIGKMIPQNVGQAVVIGIANMFKSDFVQIERLRAFASLVKNCVVEAVEKLYEEERWDKKKLNRMSSGVLGPI
jgi:hypothetical protein